MNDPANSRGAGVPPASDETAGGTPARDRRDPAARLRWSVYLLLIFLSAGAMLGRILAVDSVDTIGLEKYRLNKIDADLARNSASCSRKAFPGRN